MWMKKVRELFDVTMGGYDGAEICELVGLFILYKFQQLNKINNFGLYRDDELAEVKDMTGLESEKVKKVLFKKFGINLIIECNKTSADYLDIILNLLDETCKPYQNQKINYSTFTKNLITLQISSNKFELQSKGDFQTTHQTKQFSVIQPKIMKRPSKNQVIMSNYSTNQQVRIQIAK